MGIDQKRENQMKWVAKNQKNVDHQRAQNVVK